MNLQTYRTVAWLSLLLTGTTQLVASPSFPPYQHVLELRTESFAAGDERYYNFEVKYPSEHRVEVSGDAASITLWELRGPSGSQEWIYLTESGSQFRPELTVYLKKGFYAIKVRSERQQMLSVRAYMPKGTPGLRLIYNGLALTAPSTEANGYQPYFAEKSDQEGQFWHFVDGQLISESGQCLAVQGDQLYMNGGRILMWECNGTWSQNWRYDQGRLISGGGMCLDIPSGFTQYGVQIWSCNNQPWQEWQQEYVW